LWKNHTGHIIIRLPLVKVPKLTKITYLKWIDILQKCETNNSYHWFTKNEKEIHFAEDHHMHDSLFFLSQR
jgi:hypothetical protein